MNDKTLFRWRAETGFLVLRESYEFIFRYLFRYLFFIALIDTLKIGLLRVSHWHHTEIRAYSLTCGFFVSISSLCSKFSQFVLALTWIKPRDFAVEVDVRQCLSETN